MSSIHIIKPWRWLAAIGLVAALLGCHESTPHRAGAIDALRLADAAKEPGMWFTGGRDAGQTYYSPLATIDARTVGRLGFAWEYRMPTQRGLEATPIVVDGVMYTSGPWGVVYALEANSGKLRWSFDPKNDGLRGRYTCCDFVNRGVAVWKGRVYVASLDGRLFSLDAATGQKIWEEDTIENHAMPYTSTGAPIVAGDVVVIGNGGADIGRGGVRGYVTAYDAVTGRQQWRFYTVPECGKRLADDDQEKARKTWSPDCQNGAHGGGTVWDGLAYDDALKLLYIGVGNASPYLRKAAGAGEPFDDLYVASIVALDVRNGKVVWHYQTTPGEIWDYTATAKMVLTDLNIGGKPRSVLMQAPKNGYFYVLDRRTGEVISATPYTFQNWTLGMDEHFRPKISPQANYAKSPKVIAPSQFGGHNWQPMSYDLKTGLVYLPVVEAANLAVNLQGKAGALTDFVSGYFSSFLALFDNSYRREDYEGLLGPLPKVDPVPGFRTVLKAWDPVAQRVVWEHESWHGTVAPSSGVMSTAGGLVFHGGADGHLRVHDASSGALLKEIDTGTTIMAAPMTYSIDGVQYVAVMGGWGGSLAAVPFPAGSAAANYENVDRIMVFRLDGKPETPKPPRRVEVAFTQPPVPSPSPDVAALGAARFTTYCSVCHAFATALNPDLRRPQFGSDNQAMFRSIVLNGALAVGGMGRFDDVLSQDDVDAIYAFVIDQRWLAFRAQQSGGTH